MQLSPIGRSMTTTPIAGALILGDTVVHTLWQASKEPGLKFSARSTSSINHTSTAMVATTDCALVEKLGTQKVRTLRQAK